jgi:hypothetical protein
VERGYLSVSIVVVHQRLDCDKRVKRDSRVECEVVLKVSHESCWVTGR